MNDAGIIESERAFRVSAGHRCRDERTEAVLSAAREAADSIPVAAVGPTGIPALEPLVAATAGDETAFVPRCDPAAVPGILASLREGTAPTDEAAFAVAHEPAPATLPMPDAGPLGVGSRRALAGCGWARPTAVDDYAARREPLAARESVADGALELLAAGGVRGRGRGDAVTDEPIAELWRTVRGAAGDPVVVVHANEPDSRAAADRVLLAGDPLSVLDPALVAARVVGATDVVVHVNERHERAARTVEAAADALADRVDVPVRVTAGPDAYKAGETTMALEALEGNDRIEARRSPPAPSEHGLFGRPTVVHTPRTFAQVGRALAGEPLGGADGDPGTRLVTVGGDVTARATVELSTDADLATALDAVELDGPMKAACVGGAFGGLTRTLAVPASAPALREANLGTNGVVEVLGEGRCAVALAGERASFAREENCGRCVPCREGSTQLTELLREVYDGEYPAGKLRELSRVMERSSACGFGRDATRPVATAMAEFEAEFRAHADGRCPAGECERGGA